MKRSSISDRKKFVDTVSNTLWEHSKLRSANKIPYAGVVFDKEEVKEVVGALYDAFTSRWFALGKHGDDFEKEFSRYLGVNHCILTNSGSSANLLAVASMSELKKLRPGDEVLTPAVTFPTAINPLLLYKLKPVLVDVTLPSYTVSAEELRKASSPKTKGIMLPHLNGSASYMPEIIELAERKGWVLIEDCCDALGTFVDGRNVGTFGQASTFSFYAAHHLCMGEGGAVCTNNEEVATTVRSLRDWGRSLGKEIFDLKKGRRMIRIGGGSTLPDDYEARYIYTTRGFNLKPIDIQPAMGLAQLKKIKSFGKARRHNYRFLLDALSKFEKWLILPRAAEGVDPSWFVFPVIVRDGAGFTRRELVDHLEKGDIETRPILAGNIANQPAYQDIDLVIRGSLRNSGLILRGGFFVGVYPGLSEAQMNKMVKTFTSFFRSRSIA
ncbi:MAG: lipopolysaccharide biosynthesis protein RfbH [Thaumarchaeota archaeon]|nr:lipopolysaccharide biosynthesis protein RfbH [Nitrososphaerota archaeon]